MITFSKEHQKLSYIYVHDLLSKFNPVDGSYTKILSDPKPGKAFK